MIPVCKAIGSVVQVNTRSPLLKSFFLLQDIAVTSLELQITEVSMATIGHRSHILELLMELGLSVLAVEQPACTTMVVLEDTLCVVFRNSKFRAVGI